MKARVYLFWDPTDISVKNLVQAAFLCTEDFVTDVDAIVVDASIVLCVQVFFL